MKYVWVLQDYAELYIVGVFSKKRYAIDYAEKQHGPLKLDQLRPDRYWLIDPTDKGDEYDGILYNLTKEQVRRDSN